MKIGGAIEADSKCTFFTSSLSIEMNAEGCIQSHCTLTLYIIMLESHSGAELNIVKTHYPRLPWQPPEQKR